MIIDIDRHGRAPIVKVEVMFNYQQKQFEANIECPQSFDDAKKEKIKTLGDMLIAELEESIVEYMRQKQGHTKVIEGGA